ncbi:hypothetical protein LRAMOSA03407 [Lichtheimia ramosa]|uniref:Kelch repeat protein n=1 Tax=Lichtheimia ramosa TaxID=688394 RepID=A0A077WV57_9FUNG|nr:hypothetical protein LRAMOSA03407 [Lichtheimia ramosa]
MRSITTALSITALAAGIFVSADQYPNGFGTGCTLVKSSIYCYGGSPSPADYNFVNATNSFYTLDISSTINIPHDQSSWVALPTNGTNAPKPNMLFGMAAFADSDTFIMAGGTGIAAENQALPHQTLTYNTSSNTWTPIDSGLFVQTKLNILVANADTGNNMFMYGGVSDLSTGYTTIDQSSRKQYPSRPRLLSYGNNGWTWSFGNGANAKNTPVVGRERHTMAQGKDGRFYVFGGQTATPNNATQPWPYAMADADMKNILIYDISRGWTEEMMTGDIPSTRWHASSVTLNDGSILLYGGAKPGFQQGPNNEQYLDPVDDVAYVLNTQNGQWENITPRITTRGAKSRDDLQFQRFGHSMVRVSNNNVFILFGRTKGTQNAEGYLILDTSTWTLVDSFDGVSSPGDAQDMDGQTPGEGSSLSGGAIAGIVVGVVVGIGLIAGILAFVFIRRRRNARQHKESIMNAHPSHDDDWHHHNQPATPTDDMYSSSSTQVGETMPPISSVIYGGEAMKPESKDTPRLKLQPVKPDGA